MRKIHLLAMILVTLWGRTGAVQSVLSPTECNQTPLAISVLTKPGEGWDVAFAKGAKVLKKGPFKVQNGKELQDSGLTVIQYEVKEQIITLPKLEVNPCDRSATLSNWYLKPMQVLGFEKNSQLFAYQVWGDLAAGPRLDSPVFATDMHILFYDMHGDGVFDLIRIGSGVGIGGPSVPDWVEKAATNRPSRYAAKQRHR